jgi:hypothetical protein
MTIPKAHADKWPTLTSGGCCIEEQINLITLKPPIAKFMSASQVSFALSSLSERTFYIFALMFKVAHAAVTYMLALLLRCCRSLME